MYGRQTVLVDNSESSGYVLDVGGGDEGIIGILKGNEVVATDLRKSELEEAPDDPLKLVADGRDLPFLNRTVDTAAPFFSLMYLKHRADVRCVFAEAHRVLTPGGRFLVWDEHIARPKLADKGADVVLLLVRVAGREIATGYGQPWPEEPRDAVFHVAWAEEAGFERGEAQEDARFFRLELHKSGWPALNRRC